MGREFERHRTSVRPTFWECPYLEGQISARQTRRAASFYFFRTAARPERPCLNGRSCCTRHRKAQAVGGYTHGHRHGSEAMSGGVGDSARQSKTTLIALHNFFGTENRQKIHRPRAGLPPERSIGLLCVDAKKRQEMQKPNLKCCIHFPAAAMSCLKIETAPCPPRVHLRTPGSRHNFTAANRSGCRACDPRPGHARNAHAPRCTRKN